MKKLLEGKVAIVTGGGNGIGRAAAILFAREGARVLVADINEAAARATAEIAGADAFGVACDVSQEDQVEKMVAAAVSRWGRLDAAFNNAGIGAPEASLIDDNRAVWQRILDVDLFGVMYCMKHQIPAMLKSGGGAIVNNASNAGKRATPKIASYGAAKAAAINLSLTAAVEFGGRGIRVNAVCPGMILTDTMKGLLAGNVDHVSGLQIPVERGGEPEEVAELAAWLLSSRASYVTGQAISIDGGMSACQ